MANQLITKDFKKSKPNRIAHSAKRRQDGDSKEASVPKQDIDMLKQFDLNWQFGPCSGITRLQRWDRAERHGLLPPQAVRDLIQQNINDDTYTQCVWHEYGI